MRYFLSRNTLFISGSFRAAGSGIPDPAAAVSAILNHTLAKTEGTMDAQKELELAAASAGAGRDHAGFATTIPVRNLCVFQCDFLTFFITAEAPGPDSLKPGSARAAVIVCSRRRMPDAALHESAGIARGALSAVLSAEGIPPSGTEPVIVACEENRVQDGEEFGEPPVGSRIRATLRYGIPVALRRSAGPARDRPAFFIYSRFQGEHWVEWTPENCPYYPCHFEGQRCDFCYCPLYPCGNESLGHWTGSSNGGKVWSCAGCTMVHEPAVADYLKRNPEASAAELVRVWKKTGRAGAGHKS